MNQTLRIAFLAAAMLATAAHAVPVKAPAPGPQFLGTDIGSFALAGTADGTFYVTLDAGNYVITGDIKTTAASNKNFNLSGVTVTSGSLIDSFENQGSDHYFEVPYLLTVVAPTKLFLAVDTNDKKGGYAGTLTIAEAPIASAVPEPTTTALLLAGMVLLGIAARRRRT